MLVSPLLVVHQSCGCLDPVVVQAAAGQVAAVEQFEAAWAAQRKDAIAEIARAVGAFPTGVEHGWAGQLLDGFAAEVSDEAQGAFLSTLNDILCRVAAIDGDATAWHGPLSILRRRALSCLGNDDVLSRVEDLWQQARLMIAETQRRPA
jgi:hypothetical protein